MEYIPLVFFGILFVFILFKKGFDVSAYVTLLYFITSFFSFLMFKYEMVEDSYSHPSLSATFVYCFLLLISIVPIYRLNIRDVDLHLTKNTERTIIRLTYVFLFNLVFFLFFRFNEIYRILVYGDFLSLRQDVIDDVVVRHAVGFEDFLNVVTNIVSSISFVMILVFFISISYYKKPWYFNLFAFLGSLPMVLAGILTINRSNVFYYVIIFGLCCVVFWRRISRRMKIRFFPPVFAAFLGMMVFFSAVTQDRFENSFSKVNNDFGGSNNSIIVYAGQPYSNFCYFFDYYVNPDWTSTRFLFPVSNYLINGYRAGTEREQEQTLRTGVNCVVFLTFLGSFIMDSNLFTPFFFLLIYLFLFRLCRKHIRYNTISFVWLLAVFLLMIIPAVGCISYFYNSPFKMMALYILLIAVSRKKAI